jgi:hypothetical protein
MPKFSRQHRQAASHASLRPPYMIFPTLFGGSNTPSFSLHKLVPQRSMPVLPQFGQARLLGIEKFDHIPLLDFAHRHRKCQTDTTE